MDLPTHRKQRRVGEPVRDQLSQAKKKPASVWEAGEICQQQAGGDLLRRGGGVRQWRDDANGAIGVNFDVEIEMVGPNFLWRPLH